MDYEKLYKEALERAKIFKQNWEGIEINSDLALKELKEIFPELSENKDEKIKNAIKQMYSFLQNKPEYIGSVPIKEIFEWLDKQVPIDKGVQEEPILEQSHVEKLRLMKKCVHLAFRQGYNSDVQTANAEWEYKSEWSEEDSIRLNQAIYVLHTQGYTDVENWLKNLNPQKINVESEQKSLLEDK